MAGNEASNKQIGGTFSRTSAGTVTIIQTFFMEIITAIIGYYLSYLLLLLL